MWFLSWLGCASAAPPADPAARVDKIEKMYSDYRRLGFAKVPDIEPTELSTLDSPVLVDVRTPEEQAVSMLPGAITQEEFEAHPEKYRGHTIVPYCTIGARSGMYGKKLMNDGWEVRNLRGSVLLWTFTGQPLQGPDGPTHEVHTYGRKWALVADGYNAVY